LSEGQAGIEAKEVVIAPPTLVPDIHDRIEIAGEKNEQSWSKQLGNAGFSVTAADRAFGEHPQGIDLFERR